MQDQPVALGTGTHRGIGFRIAKDLAGQGFTARVGSRNLQRGEVAARTVEGDAHALQLDVTDQASIAAAATRVGNEFGRLDLLVNSAAISNATLLPGTSIEEYSRSTRPSHMPLDEVQAVWEANVIGVLAVYLAVLPLLRETPAARVLNVSIGVGSLTLNSTRPIPGARSSARSTPRPRQPSTL